MRTLLHVLAFAALVLAGAPIAGCSDAPKSSRRRGSGATKKVTKKAGPEEIDKSMIPAKLRNANWKEIESQAIDLARGIRDPFQPHVDDLFKQKGEIGPDDDTDLGVKIPEPVGGLSLIAIITGTAVHKAMVVDKDGVGHIVRAGEIIGKPPMRITRITRNEVLFKGLTPPEDPNEKEEEVRKVLLTQAELEELLP